MGGAGAVGDSDDEAGNTGGGDAAAGWFLIASMMFSRSARIRAQVAWMLAQEARMLSLNCELVRCYAIVVSGGAYRGDSNGKGNSGARWRQHRNLIETMVSDTR